MTSIDIIIPHYNNTQVLGLTITALYQQALPPQTLPRLIVIDDGSKQGIQFVGEIPTPAPWQPAKFLSQQHQGSAVARNLGVENSTADLILFLGDDIILRPNALSSHLNFHQQAPASNCAALGFVRWDPRLNPSPLMLWLEHGGPQNNYDFLLHSDQADPSHFLWGSHLSLKRKVLPSQPFNNIFVGYGWEDLELGRRLAKKGLILTPLPSAIGLHHHTYLPLNFYRRQLLAGASLPIYQDLHPQVSLMPKRSVIKSKTHRLLVFLGFNQFLFLWLNLVYRHFSLPRFFAVCSTSFFWEGVYKAQKRHISPNNQ